MDTKIHLPNYSILCFKMLRKDDENNTLFFSFFVKFHFNLFLKNRRCIFRKIVKKLLKVVIEDRGELLTYKPDYLSDKYKFISKIEAAKCIHMPLSTELLKQARLREIYEEFSDYESIYKYQSAEYIMKEVLCYCAEYARPMTGMYHGKKEFEVHGVYSPIGRCGKSVLAESLAGAFGKKKKTLLLDLQSYSARREQLGQEELWDLADMIYFLRQGKQTFLYKLGSIVRNQGAFDYILPMKAPADIRSVTLAEWSELLEKLATDSDYQVVVIDFGNEVCGLFQLLEQCTRIYMPMISDTECQRKLENFEWILRDENFENLIQNIQKIYLPTEFEKWNVKGFMQEWAERSVMS